MIVWTNDEVVLRLGIVLVVFGQVIDGRARPAEIVTGGRQHRDIDARKLLLVRDHGAPVGIVAWVVDPVVKDRIGRAIDLVQIAISAAADIPVMIQLSPPCVVVVGWLVERLVVRGVEGPWINEAPVDVAFHGHIDARPDRRAHHHRL